MSLCDRAAKPRCAPPDPKGVAHVGAGRETQAMMRLNPYISFQDTAKQALDFYQSVLGGEAHSNTFGEFGMADTPAADLLMHGMLETPAGFTIMCADTPPGMDYNPGTNVTISLSGDDVAELTRYFTELSEGGQVVMPLEKQMWGDVYGAFVDKFGINWMVNIAGEAAGDN